MSAASGGADGYGRTHEGLRVLDEAVRLLDVLQAGRAGADHARPAGAAQGPAHDADCRFCPVCRGLAALREANPEAMARLTRAFGDLAAAFGELVAHGERREPPAAHNGATADGARQGPTPSPPVQHIDVGD